MFCHEYDLSLWLAYLEKRLDTTTIHTLENHLQNCPLCLSELLELNRISTRMSVLSPTHNPSPPLVDHFSLVLQKAQEAIDTLFGHLTPLPLPATRSTPSTPWQYTSQSLQLTLLITPQETSFSLTLSGPHANFSLWGEKPIFHGSIQDSLTLTNLPPGTYTLITDKGKLSFSIVL
ncbi:MAG: hypothetical protein N2314_05695 [Brevinematales bacterium]|nr:hypothetical protein [Brevinematales bacterium]